MDKTKTKRQLRAEAVERLRSATFEDCDNIPRVVLGNDYPNWVNYDTVTFRKVIAGRIADLLTDDELPESDAVARLRDLPTFGTVRVDGELKTTDMLMVCATKGELLEIADMVERDYVRREDYVAMGKSLGLAQAERDGWKARAESSSEVRAGSSNDGVKRGKSNLEWMYGADPFFRDFSEWYAVEKSHAMTYHAAYKWLLSEHVDAVAQSKPQSKEGASLSELYGILSDDCGRNADMSENAPDCVRNDAFMSENGVSADAEGSNGANVSQVVEHAPERLTNGGEMLDDTREKLEADVRSWHNKTRFAEKPSINTLFGWLDRQAAITERESFMRGRASLDDEFAELQAELEAVRRERDELKKQMDTMRDVARVFEDERDDCADDADRAEAELKRERAQREHWQCMTGKHAAEVQRLRKQLDAPLPEGVEWPRFEDGAIVRYGDKCAAGRVQSIQFFNPKYGPQLSITGVDTEKRVVLEKGERVKRPPLLAADGQPIEVGQVLYSELDGKAWTVDRIGYGQPHSVIAHCCGSERGLKPGWLTHERPDSARVIAEELREFVSANLIALGNGQYREYDELNDLADRIEKLAKEGA